MDRASTRFQKNRVWETVLEEQYEQEQNGCYDAERIARLCRSVQVEHNCQQTVLDRARKDRMDADSYLLTPRTMKLAKITAPGMAFAAPLLVVETENIAPRAGKHGGDCDYDYDYNGNDDDDDDDGNGNRNDDDDEPFSSSVARPKTDTGQPVRAAAAAAAKQCGGRFGIRRQFRRFSV
eukprot:jgi/Psemu1/312212/fgenesh1_kg.898_\